MSQALGAVEELVRSQPLSGWPIHWPGMLVGLGKGGSVQGDPKIKI